MLLALARGRPPERTAEVYRVESEADWGRRIDEVVEFTSPEDAERYGVQRELQPGPLRSEWSMVAKLARDGHPLG